MSFKFAARLLPSLCLGDVFAILAAAEISVLASRHDFESMMNSYGIVLTVRYNGKIEYVKMIR